VLNCICICIFVKLIHSILLSQQVKLYKSLKKHTGRKAFLECAGRGLKPLRCSQDVEKLGCVHIDSDCPIQGKKPHLLRGWPLYIFLIQA